MYLDVDSPCMLLTEVSSLLADVQVSTRNLAGTAYALHINMHTAREIKTNQS